jgi:hypothetical protein
MWRGEGVRASNDRKMLIHRRGAETQRILLECL